MVIGGLSKFPRAELPPVFLQNLKVQLYFRQKLIRASRKTLRWSSGCRNPVADFTFTIHTKRIVHVSVWLLRITLRLAFRQGRVRGVCVWGVCGGGAGQHLHLCGLV